MTGPASGGWRIGVDIGGTFTDVVLLGPDESVTPLKVLSTPPNFGDGVIAAIEVALERAGADAGQVAAVLHGTTVATNAILESRGAVTALITTRGFRDVLELGRLRRPKLYDIDWEKPRPLVPRERRLELDQRILATGEILEPAAPESIAALVAEIEGADAESVAVCLLNGYAAPDEERRVADAVRQALPDRFVTASVDISPEMREYERTSTAVVNSYVGPVVRRYIEDLDAALRAHGVHAPFLIMQSSGGLIDAGMAGDRPVQLIESGPAAGVIAVRKLAQRLELEHAIAFDMGGTTAKASLIEGGEPFTAAEFEVGGGMNAQRGLSQGGGYAVRVPSIDIAEVGAGGGSIVWRDEGGSLRVGPQSAGSTPGPACYARGGTEPTLTDANVLLGYLSPLALAGGRVPIDPERARAVFGDLAEAARLDVLDAARGAYAIAVNSMRGAVKAVTSERGRDPRGAVLVGFGGAGPLYAAELARELGIGTVLIPTHPGLFSSLGVLVADIERQEVSPWSGDWDDHAAVEARYAELQRTGTGVLLANGHAADEIVTERIADLRYRGQRSELRVSTRGGTVDAEVLDDLRQRFHVAHERTYGRRAADALVELVNLRVRCTAPNPVELAAFDQPDSAEDREPQVRLCYFGAEHGTVETPVRTRAHLSNTPLDGPMIVEDMDSTTVVPPGATCRLDAVRNIVITWPAEENR
ncbi:Acetophenone carboxylase gamma subunit [Baekduia alba]|uniref:hydantoinase/oxoprolinase family protein n=1 Tax=Baekduia alba TaxID=2997333 RepID=UPI0023411D4F|nr:hydantoinase/oxoprolinase family protein [Baekduia alba]WCB91494.1 Acetophenone carboxylase gamma subunit [Baekduia alba]